MTRPHEAPEFQKELVYVTEENLEEREKRPAHRINIGSALLDIFIAILPLYFVAFAVFAFLRDDTLATSYRNMVIFQMSKINPTAFPILFTLILAKFIKAIANWKLEQGATVGHIQHLLAPLLLLVWTLNPIGGQLSLRIVSKVVNTTYIDMDFVYLDPMIAYNWNRLFPDHTHNAYVDAAFASALFTPVTSKNGTADIFGNVQIPMLEMLEDVQPDLDGWYNIMPNDNITGHIPIGLDVFGFIETSLVYNPVYASIIGIPFIANSSTLSLSQFESAKQDTAEIGTGVDNIRSTFNIETSYMRAACSLQPLTFQIVPYSGTDNYTATAREKTWANNTDGIAADGLGLSIYYDPTHSSNSTSARRIGFASWIVVDGMSHGYDLPGMTYNQTAYSLSKAWCDLTTTYLEAEIYCRSRVNCTVSRIRPSTTDHYPANLTVLDGISIPTEGPDAAEGDPEAQQEENAYVRSVAEVFFKNFVRSTSNFKDGTSNLSPLETYIENPDYPFKYSSSQKGASYERSQPPLFTMGSELFSQRLTQLLNTYWLTSISTLSMSVVSGVDLDMTTYGESEPMTTSPGQILAERIVLRCNIPFMAMVVTISAGLFVLGLATAYLDATRRGPDVLDDFVNSLRHNPYVHVDQGPSMEDGQEKARRLRKTMVKMGDVKPDDLHGYVAIATPNETQPVQRLDPKREYV